MIDTNLETGQIPEEEEPKKIWNKIFINMFIINLMFHLCTTAMNTLTAKYASFLGGSATVAGAATGMFAATAIIFKIISAPALDSLNRKKLLLGAIGVMTVAFVGYTFSNSIPMLMASRLVQGAGQAFTTTGCLAIAASSLPNGKMASGIGYFALSSAVTRAVAPQAGLLLVDLVGYNYTFAILACIMGLTIVFTASMKLEHKKTKKFKISPSTIVAKEALLPAGIYLVIAIAMSMTKSFLVLFTDSLGMGSEIGIFFTVSAVVLMITRPFIGTFADKFGVIKVLIPALLCTIASFFIISASSALWMFLVAAVVLSFGQGGTQPSMQATIMRSVPADRRGSASCTSYLALDTGTLIGPVIGGAVIDQAGYVAAWQLMTIPIFIGLAMVIIFRKKIASIGQGVKA